MENELLMDTLESLEMKLRALSHHAYDHLESIETSLNTKWCKENKLAYAYMQEVNQDLYITTTLISDIQKDVERLKKEVKEKADTSQLNTLASDEVPATRVERL